MFETIVAQPAVEMQLTDAQEDLVFSVLTYLEDHTGRVNGIDFERVADALRHNDWNPAAAVADYLN